MVAEPTGSTDHELMSRIGVPAFQFIQDPLDYESRVHHTDIDTFDHLRAEDLRQASVILATVLLDAANSPAPATRLAAGAGGATICAGVGACATGSDMCT